MPQGLTQDQAKQEFAKYGLELKEFYHNSSIPCLCVCSCGTLTNIRLAQVKQNRQLATQLHNLLQHCLERTGTSKEGHTHEILGYSASELDNHLRSFPMYAYLQDIHTLAIDHILPVKAFIEHGIVDPKIICVLDNLQPLSRSENCEKKDWYIEEEFLAYCQQHNIILLEEVI